MKKTVFLSILLALFSNLNAQDITNEITSKDSVSNKDSQKVESIQVNEVGRYKLYPTQNTFNFLKLDTRTGVITRVQWNTEYDKRFEKVVSSRSLIDYNYDEVINGRFEISLTENIYNFLLLDKIDGRIWQCQWNFDVDKNMIIRIN